jgi:transcriptional regulator with XRE-family HTH domain
MPDHTDMHIGVRLRDVRKRRGLTQHELASESGVSLSLIRKLEQGELKDTRLETARRLAVALRVPTTRLLTRDDTPNPADAPTVDQWEPVRRALASPLPAPEVHEEPTVVGVADALIVARQLFAEDRLAELAVALPPLLRDGDTLADDPAARGVRVQLMQVTAALLTQTHQYRAAETALERALADAGNELEGAATVNTMCWLLLRQGRLKQAQELAVRWADDLEPRLTRATPAELSAWGGMLLRVSAVAVRDNRLAEAKDALRFARAAAIALGRDMLTGPDLLRTFGPVTVAQLRAEHAAITDQPDQVLKLHGAIPAWSKPTAKSSASNRHRHLLDVADAHVKLRDPASSVGILRYIQEAAPEWLPQQRYARDILARVIDRRRTLTPEIRELADAIGVPL